MHCRARSRTGRPTTARLGNTPSAPPRECSSSGQRKEPLDGEPVVDLGDAGRLPCGALGLLALGPGPHLAAEDDLAAVGLDGDLVRFELGAALERLLDLALDLRRRDPRLDVDEVADALYAL